LGEAAERQAGAFLVADSPLDLERVGAPRLRRVEIASDGVEDTLECRGEPFGPGEAERAAPFDALRGAPEAGFEIESDQPDALKKCSDAELAIGFEL